MTKTIERRLKLRGCATRREKEAYENEDSNFFTKQF
jgi:hypothetical protein